MTFREFVDNQLVGFVDGTIMPLLYALAFFFFVFGIARTFITSNEEKRAQGRQLALWGIIAFVVLFGVWGIVRLLLGALGSA